MFVGNDENCDANPVTDRVGWSPRNAYRGDRYYGFDLRLSRSFNFAERKQLLMAFDAFDVFNRQNINEVTSVNGGGTADFCGGSTPFNGPEPQHYAALLMMLPQWRFSMARWPVRLTLLHARISL
jgi:hypothetical protein